MILKITSPNPRNITSCMHLHFIAKNVERMGDLDPGELPQLCDLRPHVVDVEKRRDGVPCLGGDQRQFVESLD